MRINYSNFDDVRWCNTIYDELLTPKLLKGKNYKNGGKRATVYQNRICNA